MKKYTRIICLSLAIVAIVYNNAFAQELIAPQNAIPVTLVGNQKMNREQGEQMVGVFFRKTHVFKSLKANTGASDEMIEKFKAYYAADLNNDRNLVFRLIMRAKLNEDNFDMFADSLLAKYTKVYSGFQKLDKSIIDGIEINKNNHKPTSKPLPGATSITPGPIVTACDNIDFETGTLAGWQACWQVNKATSSAFTVSGGSCSGTLGAVTVAAYDASTTSNQVSITSGKGVDPVAGSYIPRVCPWGGAHSVRIGDGENVGAGVGQLKQTFKVTSANANFSYSYAVVIEYPPHVYMNQPYFDINFYDSTGALIPGKANYAVVSQSGLSAGWIQVTDSHGEPAYCKKWSQVFVPLSAYIGHNVTVVVEAADCEPTAHFGYAYFDASCSAAIQQSSPAYCGQNVTLTAPAGASAYKWSGPCISGSTTAQSVIATCAGTYSCNVIGGAGDTAHLSTTLATATPITSTITPATSTVCKGASVTLTASGGATFYSWSPTAGLKADTGATVIATPTATTTYKVMGSNGSCLDSATATITVNPVATATITPSGTTTICSGASVGLTASGSATSYTWAPATGLNVTTGTSVTAKPTTTQTYTLTGSVATGCNTTATVVVAVNPTPTVTASVTPTAICQGGSATLTASGATTYTWTPNTSLSATTGASITANPASTVTYSVTGTTGTCNSAVQKVTLTVNPTPTITASATPTAICQGSSATLTGSGATSYLWSPNVNLSATTGSSITADPISTITYSVTGTAAGCSSAVQTVTVTVNPIPTVSASATRTAICPADTTTLSGSGATTYTWAPTTGLSATTGASVIADPTATQTYTLTGSAASGCNSTATVVVTVSPTPTLTALATPASICAGDSSVLTSTGATTYAWIPNTNLSSTTDSVVTAKPVSTITYTVTGTSASGCSSAPQTVTVTVNAYPVITLTGKNVTCAGIADTLTASGGTSYVWNTGGTNDTIIVHPTSATTYSVTISNGTCAKDTAIVVGVNSSPVVSVSGHVHHTCGNADTLTAHPVGAGPFAYNWTSGSTDSIAPVLINTTYSVTVTDANSCTTTKSFAVHDSVPVIPICLVTVDSTSTKIIVIWNNPGANSGIDSLFLYRDSVSGPIARFVPGDFSEFVDTTNGMDPNSHYYQYNLDGIDSCGQGSGGLTGYAKTIHLTVSPNGCGNILNWTKYSGYFTFTQYYIHRDSANMGWKTIDSVNSGTFTWTDTNCYSSGSSISYYVDVKDNNICQPSGHTKYTNITASRSNSVTSAPILTGIQQMTAANTISIFPNPVASTTHIVFGSNGKHYMEVDDVTGRKIESIECIGKQYKLSVNGLAKGIYFVKVLDEGMNFVATAKMVVE